MVRRESHEEASTNPYVRLPCDNETQWRDLYQLFTEVAAASNVGEFITGVYKIYTVAGNSTEDLKSSQTATRRSERSEHAGGREHAWPFSGLAIFFQQVCSYPEKETFFNSTLPFIASLASRLKDLAPIDGLPVLPRQHGGSVKVQKWLAASLIANGFLCSFPPTPKDQPIRSINFAYFYSCFHRAEKLSTQSAKFKCFIHYFEKLRELSFNRHRDSDIIFTRKVIRKEHLPGVEEWSADETALCPVVVDTCGTIEESGDHTLQVDFANRYIGGGVLGGGHVQEEIRFCVSPELLPAILIMEAMEANEAISIKGHRNTHHILDMETRSNMQEIIKTKQRDSDNCLKTCVLAIDATSFKNKPRGTQYQQEFLLRELNKALAGFHSPSNKCSILQPNRQNEGTVDNDTTEPYFVSEEITSYSTAVARSIIIDALRVLDTDTVSTANNSVSDADSRGQCTPESGTSCTSDSDVEDNEELVNPGYQDRSVDNNDSGRCGYSDYLCYNLFAESLLESLFNELHLVYHPVPLIEVIVDEISVDIQPEDDRSLSNVETFSMDLSSSIVNGALSHCSRNQTEKLSPVYKERNIKPSLAPQCLVSNASFSMDSMPCVPPPSPATKTAEYYLGNRLNAFHFVPETPPSTPLACEFSNSTSSFAEYLAKTIMSSVKLSACLSLSIAEEVNSCSAHCSTDACQCPSQNSLVSRSNELRTALQNVVEDKDRNERESRALDCFASGMASDITGMGIHIALDMGQSSDCVENLETLECVEISVPSESSCSEQLFTDECMGGAHCRPNKEWGPVTANAVREMASNIANSVVDSALTTVENDIDNKVGDAVCKMASNIANSVVDFALIKTVENGDTNVKFDNNIEEDPIDFDTVLDSQLEELVHGIILEGMYKAVKKLTHVGYCCHEAADNVLCECSDEDSGQGSERFDLSFQNTSSQSDDDCEGDRDSKQILYNEGNSSETSVESYLDKMIEASISGAFKEITNAKMGLQFAQRIQMELLN